MASFQSTHTFCNDHLNPETITTSAGGVALLAVLLTALALLPAMSPLGNMEKVLGCSGNAYAQRQPLAGHLATEQRCSQQPAQAAAAQLCLQQPNRNLILCENLCLINGNHCGNTQTLLGSGWVLGKSNHP